MCGIAGRLNYKTGRSPEPEAVRALSARIGHRGPDDEGVFVLDAVALCMRRLSIIDLAGGRQPIQNETGEVTAVFNGEIYNYRELRDALRRRGHIFRTASDTEVIVHLYEECGPALATQLHGMFAIAIYDRPRERLVLLRDRVGKKPLFAVETSAGLIFGSELKCFLDQPDFTPALNETALHEFLCLGYTPGPQAALKGVFQVPPGAYLQADHRGLRTGTYWSLQVDEDTTLDEESAARQVAELFRQSVHRRRVADVPVGLYLSGGIDSVAILAASAESGPHLHSAWTARFDRHSYDETPLAARAATEFGVRHRVVDCRPEELVAGFDELVYHTDNLLANPAMVPTFLLARQAGAELKVILTGGGGDELFFGYPTYDADVLASYLGFLPVGCFDVAAAISRKVLPVSFEKLSFSYKANKLLEGLHYDAEKAHYWWRTIFTDECRARLFSSNHEMPDTFRAYRRAMQKRADRSLLARANAADFEVWLRDMGLYLADAVNMAHGVEARLPFMDHELVEFVYRLPVKLKFQRGRLKKLFKRAMAGIVPPWILNAKKAGFHVPLSPWFTAELAGFVRDVLSPGRVAPLGLFRQEEIDRLIDDHAQRRDDNGYKLWNLMCFVRWHELFLQGGYREMQFRNPEVVRA